MIDGSRELRHRHAEATITHQGDHRPVGLSKLHAEATGEGEADEPKVERGEQTVRAAVAQLVGGLETHRARIHGDGCIIGKYTAERLEQP